MSALIRTIHKTFRFSPIEKVIAFFTQDKGTENFFVKLAPPNNLYKSNSLRFVKRKGINYVLDISDYQHWLIYFGIDMDRPVGLFELVKQNSIIMDVGSNIGQTAMTLAKLAGENSIILGFEPDLLNYSMCLANLNKNKFTTIFYYNVGLGSIKGSLPLKINTPSNRGGNRIDRDNNSNLTKINIDLLDAILDGRGMTRVDLIKIDVEGFELEVLKGAEKIIKSSSPTLFIEISDANLREQGTSPKELLIYLSDLGYKTIHSVTKQVVNSFQDFSNCHFDIIATI